MHSQYLYLGRILIHSSYTLLNKLQRQLRFTLYTSAHQSLNIIYRNETNPNILVQRTMQMCNQIVFSRQWIPLFGSFCILPRYLSMAYIIIVVDKMQANLFYTKTCISTQLIQLINSFDFRQLYKLNKYI